MHRLRDTPRRRGFTLLELTVALAMTAIMAVSLYGSLRGAFKARETAEAAVEPARAADIAMEFIRNDIQNATPPTSVLARAFVGTDGTSGPATSAGNALAAASGIGPSALGGGGVSGIGGVSGASDILFYTTAESAEHPAANGEIKQIELTVAPPAAGGNPVLLRRVTRNLLSESQVKPDEEILCRGVTGFTARYFDGSTWRTVWDSSQLDDTLPAAIELTLTLERPIGSPQARSIRVVRIFAPAASTAATDSTVNSGSPQ